MKGFFKAIFKILGFVAAIVGALAVVDKLTNKNRIEGDYLDCSGKSDEEENAE